MAAPTSKTTLIDIQSAFKIPYDIPHIPSQNEYNASKTLKTIMNKTITTIINQSI